MTAQNPLRPRVRGPAWWAASAIIFCAASGWFVFDAYQLTVKANQMETSLSESQRRRLMAKKPAPRASLEEERKWSNLRQEMAFPWPKLFKAVERSAGPDIELLEFEPDRQSASARLRGEARDVASLLDYVDTLSAQPGVRKVAVTSHEISATRKMEAIVFELRVTF